MGVDEKHPQISKRYSVPRPIEKGDGVAAFSCGKPPLDDFLKQRALRNEGRASRTYVVISQTGEDAGNVAAYYTLAAGGVNHEACPSWAKRNMPNPIPVIVLGRLAVAEQHKGNGIGKHLLREGMRRALDASRQIGARAIFVHAIDDDAVSFYLPFGFQSFPPNSRTLFLPMETVASSL